MKEKSSISSSNFLLLPYWTSNGKIKIKIIYKSIHQMNLYEDFKISMLLNFLLLLLTINLFIYIFI
jgi:hypothetical protein